MNAVAAAMVLLPFGLGYFAGTVGGGLLISRLDKILPHTGRVAYLQGAQILFAVVAFFATQIRHDGIAVYAIFMVFLGFCQGANPPDKLNRYRRRRRSTGTAQSGLRHFLERFRRPSAGSVFSLVAGALAATLGIQTVFFWVLVVLMLVNAAVLSSLLPATRVT